MSEQLNNKIFVGNVPFQCTTDEFQSCFRNLIGFENADIIRRYESTLSRGFGFVIFKTEEQANILLNEKEIKLKDRILRFSPYNVKNKEKSDTNKNKSYQIFVSNLNENMTHEKLKNAFVDYDIDTCFVNTKNNETHGIVTTNSHNEFKNILENPPKLNNVSLNVKPFKRNMRGTQINYYNNARIAYREGFWAGHTIGFQQGFQQGQRHKNNIIDK